LPPFSPKNFVSRLLSRNIKNRICRTIILPVLLYGCETRSLTLREENRLRVFENRVLRRITGPKRDEVTGVGENCVMRSFITCTLCQVNDQVKEDERGRACSKNGGKDECI
jgi:hypothetical protein